MKKVFALVAAVMLCVAVNAQVVQETTATVGEMKVLACTMSFTQNAKMVQNAVNQRLKDSKLKTKNSEGYLAVQDQVVPEISTSPVNVYTKVEEQGKKKNRITVLTVCATSADQTLDPAVIRNNVRTWMEGFPAYLAKFEAGQSMEAEQANLKKAEKAAASAASELSSLEKDIASDQKKIADKQNEIKKLNEEIKKLEANIQKNTAKKAEAEHKVSDANQNVKAVQKEVDRYRQLSE